MCSSVSEEQDTETNRNKAKQTTGAIFFSNAWMPSYGHSEVHLKCPHNIEIQASESSSLWQKLKTILVQTQTKDQRKTFSSSLLAM
jgi:hypothetical protein